MRSWARFQLPGISRRGKKRKIRHKMESRIPQINGWCLECQELCIAMSECAESLTLQRMWHEFKSTKSPHRIQWNPEPSPFYFEDTVTPKNFSPWLPFCGYSILYLWPQVSLFFYSIKHITLDTPPTTVIHSLSLARNIISPTTTTRWTKSRLANYSLDHKLCGWRIAAKCSGRPCSFDGQSSRLVLFLLLLLIWAGWFGGE